MNISVLIKESGNPATRKTIKNDLATLQRIVGGNVESVTLTSDIIILCNEEGAIQGLPFNVEICECEFCGTLIILGSSGEDFASLREDAEVSLRTLTPQLFESCQNMYHSTAISIALNERDANKLANLIAALTGQEAILVTFSHEENGYGHTHIFASTGPVGDAEKKEINCWINKHGGTVYRKSPTRESDIENDSASYERVTEIENNRSLERLLKCKFNEDNPLIFSVLSPEQILNDANSL